MARLSRCVATILLAAQAAANDCAASAEQDPHLHFAHGGAADFRGRNNALYNFLSAPGLAVNVNSHRCPDPTIHVLCSRFHYSSYLRALPLTRSRPKSPPSRCMGESSSWMAHSSRRSHAHTF